MPNTVTITGTPKVHKHVDAASFQFVNDTGSTIESGSEVNVGDLTGFTTEPIFDGEDGSAQIKGGPVMGFRVYLQSALAADVELGDRVIINGKDAGVAVHRCYPGRAIGLDDPAAAAGETCIAFLALEAPNQMDGEILVYAQGSLPTVLPLTDTDSGRAIRELHFDMDPAVSTTTDLDPVIAAITNLSDLPEGYRIQFNNTGAGELSYTNPLTASTIPNIVTGGFVAIQVVNGAWRLSS